MAIIAEIVKSPPKPVLLKVVYSVYTPISWFLLFCFGLSIYYEGINVNLNNCFLELNYGSIVTLSGRQTCYS